MTRATKIVATRGPASSEPAVLQHLLQAGVDVMRLNFSHGKARDLGRQRRRGETAARLVDALVVGKLATENDLGHDLLATRSVDDELVEAIVERQRVPGAHGGELPEGRHRHGDGAPAGQRGPGARAPRARPPPPSGSGWPTRA